MDLQKYQNKIKNRTGRINGEEVQKYLNEHKFSAEISFMEGYIGLENMTFDHIYINNKLQGDTFNDKAWIKNRPFGDNKLSTSKFLDYVEPYLIKEK